jgi:small conductance mechanosensitive channel
MSGHLNFRKLDADIQPFLISLIRAILTILIGLTCMSILGFETSSFAAALGAIGLAVGLALQGSLSNFAGGVLILLFKPFRLGEYIFAQGQAGYVESIQIFSTVLVTDTNKTIILPNGSLSTSSVVNISRKGFVKAEMQFQTHSSQDIDSARSAFMKVINACL